MHSEASSSQALQLTMPGASHSSVSLQPRPHSYWELGLRDHGSVRGWMLLLRVLCCSFIPVLCILTYIWSQQWWEQLGCVHVAGLPLGRTTSALQSLLPKM